MELPLMTALPPPKTKAKTKTLINFRHSRNFRREANGYLIGLKGFHSIFLPHSGMRGQKSCLHIDL